MAQKDVHSYSEEWWYDYSEESDIRPKVVCATPNFHVGPEYSRELKRVMDYHKEHEGYEHARWIDWNKDLREEYTAFAIIRNPWDRVVSRYVFCKEGNALQDTTALDYVDASSFEAFLDTRYVWGHKKYFWHRAIKGWYPAWDYVTDENDKVRCDCLRFEHYNDDIKAYFGLLTNPEPGNVTRVRGKEVGLGIDYKEIYTKETIQIVGDWYKRDIDYWGFDFDTAAELLEIGDIPTELETLFNTWGTDKSKRHKYHIVYEPVFEKLRDEINILEIGCWDGASKGTIRILFPTASIYTIDIFTKYHPYRSTKRRKSSLDKG